MPLGLILATSFMYLLTTNMDEDTFQAWGWRIPFLSSIVLIVVGYIIRRAVEESPVYTQMQERAKEASTPLSDLFRHHWRRVLLAAFIFAGNNAAGYMIIAFSSYSSSDAVGMDRPDTLIATLIGGVSWLVLTLWSGKISDKIGRRETFMIGYAIIAVWAIPMWFFVDKGELLWLVLVVVVLTVGLAPSYAPQSALYAEMFPAKVRYSTQSARAGSILGVPRDDHLAAAGRDNS